MLIVMTATDGNKVTKHYQVYGAGEGELLPFLRSASEPDCHIIVEGEEVRVEGSYPYERFIIIVPAEDSVNYNVFELDKGAELLAKMRVYDATLAYAAKIVIDQPPYSGEIIAWSDIDPDNTEPRYYKIDTRNYSNFF